MAQQELLAAAARAARGCCSIRSICAQMTRWDGTRALASCSSARDLGEASGVAPWPSASAPISKASTPPSAWYTDPRMLDADMRAVFSRSWLIAGRSAQVSRPGDWFTGGVLGLRFLCVRGDDGVLRAFHNFCRHNAMPLASGQGCSAEQFQCPYHGWTYDTKGRLRKATRLAGIEDFSAKNFGLVPLRVEEWGSYVLVNASRPPPEEAGGGRPASAPPGAHAGEPAGERAGSGASASSSGAAGGFGGGQSFRELLADAGRRLDCFQSDLRHIVTKEYHLNCNWKVFCNNYLDGGYHVPFAHGELASGIDMDTYKTEVFSRCSLQTTASAAADGDERLGKSASYVFIWPNIMINRYGPWMDTNVVVPTGPETSTVIFDYFIDPSHPRAGDEGYIAESLAASERVQLEDIALCEGVQVGLRSPAFLPGRYAPKVEGACFHFHRLLHGAYEEEAAGERRR